MRRLEMWIQILEINENGDFVPVEVVPARDVETGGIFQLRQVGFVLNAARVPRPSGQLGQPRCVPSSPLLSGSVQANPGRRTLGPGLGDYAADSRDSAGSVGGLCGDQNRRINPGRQ